LLLQNWYVGLNWNYASWSISTEAAAYAVFVFAAGPLVRGEYPRLIAAICIAVLAALGISHGGRLHVFYGFSALLRTLAEFSLGALLYRVHRADAAIPGKWLAMFAAVCVALAVLTRWDIPMVGVLACLILYGIDPTTMLARLLNSGPAVALGAWSYSIYLWHAPTHYAVMAVFSALGHPTSNLDTSSAKLLMLATILAVVGLSAFTFKYFETPARRMIRRTLLPREGLLNRSSPRWGTVDR
jgi:peptidoglycan/LPS O-acetylase OafA/YrhL